MPMPAITTSNSIRVKARSAGGGELLAMDIGVSSASYCAWAGSESEKEPQKQDCLTRDFAFGVCRSCPIKSLFHLRLRQVRAPSSGQNQLNRFTFEHGCGTCLHSIDWRDHFLHCRKARQFCAFLRDAVDHLRRRVDFFNIVYSILLLESFEPIPAIGGFFAVFLGIIWALG